MSAITTSLTISLIVLLSLLAATGRAHKVHLVVDLIRHGARSPSSESKFFPNITWAGSSELTAMGERQHCLLGRLRRQQYIETEHLLPEAYDPAKIHVRSTDVRRTLMSAQSYLLGLYPTGLQTLNQNQMQHVQDVLVPPISLSVGQEVIDSLKNAAVPFNIPLIPIYSVERMAETVLAHGTCPFIDQQSARFFATTKYTDLITVKYRMVWDEIINAYPEIRMIYLQENKNAYELADFIVCAAKDGRKPAKLSDATVEKLRELIGEIQKGEYTMDPLMNKIGMADFAAEVLGYFNRTIAGQEKAKYVLFSAHDTTEVVVLLGLARINGSISIEAVPDFASNILFELNSEEENPKDEAGYFVTIYFNGNVIHHEAYSTFKKTFGSLGEMGMSRADACRRTTGTEAAENSGKHLRPSGEP